MIFLKELISFVYWIVVFIISPRIFRRNPEYGRKIAHILLANWWFICLWFFDSFFSACIIPCIFVFIDTYATYSPKNTFVGVLKRNERDTSFGLISFPLGFVASIYLGYYWLKTPSIAGIGLMALGFGDAFAAIIGKQFNYIPYTICHNKKTVSGSIGMFVFSFVSILGYCILFHINHPLLITFICSLIGTLIEAISIKGIDNFTIPVIINIVLCFII